MMTADDCRKKAAEAEALARIVSLHTDKARLCAMADDWRRRAADLERIPDDPGSASPAKRSLAQ